jgi:hypothetical protein
MYIKINSTHSNHFELIHLKDGPLFNARKHMFNLFEYIVKQKENFQETYKSYGMRCFTMYGV